jgi:hypothetical protein
MDMNENEELRNRISNSISTEGAELPDYLVAQAAKAKPKRVFGFNSVRLGLGSMAAASLALVGAFVLPSAFAPAPTPSLHPDICRFACKQLVKHVQHQR